MKRCQFSLRASRIAATAWLGLFAFTGPHASADTATASGPPVFVGLDADLSSTAARGGEAIRRGIILALDEINANGGVLGRPMRLIERDHRGNPARGIDNMDAFGQMVDLVAVVGGVHTPVAIAQLETIHAHKLIYLGPWAAGTGVVSNGYEPNYVFRVSVRDEYAGEFLVKEAFARGWTRPGLLLWRTAWGRSNESAIVKALAQRKAAPAAIEWYNTGEKDLSRQIDALIDAGSDVIIMVAQSDGGTLAVQHAAALPPERRLPMISHWGITGGRFYETVSHVIDDVDLLVLQTFSFANAPRQERADALYQRYCERFAGCTAPEAVKAAVGTAHAYDLVHLLRRAIEKAGTIDRTAVRDALERIERHDGLMRDYAPPFTAAQHDALDASSFRLFRFVRGGALVQVAAQ